MVHSKVMVVDDRLLRDWLVQSLQPLHGRPIRSAISPWRPRPASSATRSSACGTGYCPSYRDASADEVAAHRRRTGSLVGDGRELAANGHRLVPIDDRRSGGRRRSAATVEWRSRSGTADGAEEFVGTSLGPRRRGARGTARWIARLGVAVVAIIVIALLVALHAAFAGSPSPATGA